MPGVKYETNRCQSHFLFHGIAAADVLPYFDDHVRPVMVEPEQNLER